jgi:hypothetical protein
MNPVGLTRAEEEMQQKRPDGSRTIVKPPPGAPSCRCVVPPDSGACGALATRRIIWPDADVTPACQDCADRLSMQAASFKIALRVIALR